ncbi:MAG: hypothetical protein R2776_07735 [Flavobacteriaceae bacterium]|nr:hypothetical protein [Flavobacteriaceae bacterium]
MIKKILLLLLTVTTIISCNTSSKKSECGVSWIGGKIVNPKLDYVVISHNRSIIDTVALDSTDSFIYKIENTDPGIYFFSHYEYQAMFLEPGDSVMIYVNTIEFDESLSYTGRGAEKNNLLMEFYLLNEDVDDHMLTYYNIGPEEFSAKMDSVSSSRNKFFENFKKKVKTSKAFDDVAKASITYSIYSKKELYISANSKKKVYDESIDIPKSFYAFRDSIDFGNEALRNYYPYFRFLGNYLDNLAYEKYENREPFDRFSFTHNSYKIKIIDSVITNTSLKNTLSRSTLVRYLLNGKDVAEELKMLEAFKQLNTDSSDIAEIEKLASATIKLATGNEIPNVALVSTDNTLKDLHSVIKKPTVLFFWSSESIKHYRKIHTRSFELREKYPEYNFIGINIDPHFKKWVRTVQSAGYNGQFEYQFENFKDAEQKLLVNYVNKSIIVDKDLKILDGNSNIFNTSIEEQLLGHLNQ